MSTSQSNAIVTTIVSVKGVSGVDIANGGTTNETSVIIVGVAEKSVEVFDFQFAKGADYVDSTGKWTVPLKGLTLGLHSITAHDYSNGGPSLPWTFTVVPNK